MDEYEILLEDLTEGNRIYKIAGSHIQDNDIWFIWLGAMFLILVYRGGRLRCRTFRHIVLLDIRDWYVRAVDGGPGRLDTLFVLLDIRDWYIGAVDGGEGSLTHCLYYWT